MTRTALLALAVHVLVLVPASAGAGTTRPPVGLTATPARVFLAGAAGAAIRVTNPGRSAIAVDATRAGFALDLRGRPRVAPGGGRRAATRWLSVRPARFVLGAGASATVAVSARLPARVEPGDHDALVLLTTRPSGGPGLAVRMRLGVVVVVRAPGRVVRSLGLGRLRARPAGRARLLEVWVANAGNVTETLWRGRVRLLVGSRGVPARLLAAPRELRPRTSGLAQAVYRGRLRGRVRVRAELVDPAGRIVRRTFRIRL
jgi:hypothetical protein